MPPPVPLGSIARLGVALLLGIALGLASALGDGAAPRVLVALANAISPWLLVAFVAGAFQRSRRAAAVAGAIALAAAVVTYYAPLVLVRQIGFPAHLAIAWLAIALVAGPALALLGSLWRRDHRWRAHAVGALSGAILGEAVLQLVRLEAWDGFDLARTYAQLAVANAVLAPVVIGALVTPRRWAIAVAIAGAVGFLSLIVLLGVELAFREVLLGA